MCDPQASFPRGLLPGVMANLDGKYLLPPRAAADRFLFLRLVGREHKQASSLYLLY